MVYSEVVKAGLCGILPKKKRYGSHKDICIIDKAIRANTEFCQKAMTEKGADYLNEIIGNLTAFVLKCNIIYNEEN